jgi:beta-lactamase class A
MTASPPKNLTFGKNRRQRLQVVPRQPAATSTNPPLTVAVQPVGATANFPQRQRSTSAASLTSLSLYLLRLAILGVGMSAIAGTALTLVKPGSFLGIQFGNLPPQAPLKAEKTRPVSQPVQAAVMAAKPVAPTKELTDLKQKLQVIASKYPKLQPQAYFIDLDNGAYVDLKAETPIAAASTIKIPIFVAFLRAVDAGKVKLDEQLAMTADVKASGSGDMQYLGDGKKYTALETATKMIVISDNSATNMLIKRLGGKAALNQQFKEWGLTATAIQNPLPDLPGTNTTSTRDHAYLLQRVNHGELLSLPSRDRLLDIMRQTKTRTLLPQGLEKEATIAHKTGDIGSIIGDAGIVDMPTGKRYIGAVLVKRPQNDPNGRELIQQMSRTVYQHFKWYLQKPEKTAVKTQTAKPGQN